MANIPNTIDLQTIKDRAKQLGEESAKGGDAQVKFHLQIFEGSFHTTLSNDKDKHGKGIDDATMLSEIYFKARAANAQWDAKAANNRKLISTARLDIRAGQWAKGGSNEPLSTVHNLMSIWQNMRKSPQNQGRMEDATNVLHRYFRLQLKRNDLLEDAELRTLCTKRVKDPKSLEKFWEDTAKAFQKLKVGSLASSTLQDDHSAVDLIRNACKERLSDLKTAEQLAAEEEAALTAQEISDAADEAAEDELVSSPVS